MTYKRIFAIDVEVGDLIASTRTGRVRTVQRVDRGPKANYITFVDGSRIRPQHVTKLWKAVT